MTRRFCTHLRNLTKSFEEMPAPRGLPVIGTTLSLIAAGSAPKLHLYIHSRHKQLGSVFKDKIGPISAVFTSDPQEMRAIFAQEGKYPAHVLPEAWTLYNDLYGCSRGLLFMNGEEWLYFRRIMNNLLLKGDLKYIEHPCEIACNELVQDLRKQKPEHLEGILYRWSLNVLTAILMGSENYLQYKIQLEPTLTKLASTVHLVFQASVKLQVIPATFASRYKLAVWKRFEEAVDSALGASNELVSKLLDYPNTNNDGLLQKMLEEKMSRSDVIRIVSDLVLAAGDTTAYTMQWILYLVSKNKPLQQQLREELTGDSRTLLKNTIKETLRLYPVAPFITRFLPENGTLGGYEVPKGTLVILSLFTCGRDGKLFENPEAFVPERWLRDGKNKLSVMQQASVPFAVGARSCVGRKIAEMQLQSALEKVVRNFDVELLNRNEVQMVLKMVGVPSERIELEFREL